MGAVDSLSVLAVVVCSVYWLPETTSAEDNGTFYFPDDRRLETIRRSNLQLITLTRTSSNETKRNATIISPSTDDIGHRAFSTISSNTIRRNASSDNRISRNLNTGTQSPFINRIVNNSGQLNLPTQNGRFLTIQTTMLPTNRPRVTNRNDFIYPNTTNTASSLWQRFLERLGLQPPSEIPEVGVATNHLEELEDKNVTTVSINQTEGSYNASDDWGARSRAIINPECSGNCVYDRRAKVCRCD